MGVIDKRNCYFSLETFRLTACHLKLYTFVISFRFYSFLLHEFLSIFVLLSDKSRKYTIGRKRVMC